MAAGDVHVAIVNGPTVASVKTAVEAAITATSAAARVTVSTLNTDDVLITAIEV